MLEEKNDNIEIDTSNLEEGVDMKGQEKGVELESNNPAEQQEEINTESK